MYENEYDPMDDELVYLTMGYEPCNSKHKKEFNRVRIRVRKKVVKLISEVTDDEENWHS
jgi:predicted sulfurtransferase